MRTLEHTFKSLIASVVSFLFRAGRRLPPEPDSIRKILVVRQHDQLGDMLCVVPLLRALREKYSRSEISLVASPVNEEIMRHHALLERVYCYDKKEFLRRRMPDLRAAFRFLRLLRTEHFDLALVPTTVSVSLTSNLLAILSGAPFRVGPARLNGEIVPSGGLFNLPVEPDWRTDPHRHQTLKNFDSGKPLSLGVPSCELEITLSVEESSKAKAEVTGGKGKGRFAVAFHPGAGKPPNRWPAERFAVLAGKLANDFGASIFVTKGPMDDEPVHQMLSHMSVPAVIIDRRPIREVAALLSAMDLVVSNDTGIMHVAAGVGTAVLSLFGPTDPLQWAPPGEKHRFLRKGDDIRELSVDDVYEAASGMLR